MNKLIYITLSLALVVHPLIVIHLPLKNFISGAPLIVVQPPLKYLISGATPPQKNLIYVAWTTISFLKENSKRMTTIITYTTVEFAKIPRKLFISVI